MSDVETVESVEPQRRRPVAPFIALAVALVLGSLFWVLATSSSGPTDTLGLVESPLIGKPAPAVRGTTADGATFELSRRKGSWVVVNFFNSRCVPCKAEHPELVAFIQQQATLGADGAELYAIDQPPDSAEEIKAFFAERGGNWPVVLDDDGLVNVAFGVAQVPETFIIDPDGIVRVRWAGPIDSVTLALLVQQERNVYGAQ